MEGRGKANFYHLYISRAYAVTHRLTFGGNGFAEREKNSRAHPYVSAVRVCERVFDFAAPRMFENPSLFFAAKWKKKIFITQHFGRLCLSVGAHRYPVWAAQWPLILNHFKNAMPGKHESRHTYFRQKFESIRTFDAPIHCFDFGQTWFGWCHMAMIAVLHGSQPFFYFLSLLFSHLLFVHKMI